MRSARITPYFVWVVLAAVFAGAMAFRIGAFAGLWPLGLNPNTPFSLIMVAAYLVSLLLSLQIARDHGGSAAMHMAWLLFAGSSAMSMVRHFLQAVSASFPGFRGQVAYVPIQLPMAISLVLLFAGLLSMWSAFSALGLGFRAKRVDIAAVTLMLLMLPPILIANAVRLPPTMDGWVLILPFAGAILLPACAAVAVLLHRITTQMRGGQTACALRCLIWFPGLRLLAMLLTVDPRLRAVPVFTVVAYAIYQAAPLLFTLAVAYRWQITVKAEAAIQAEPSTWNEIYPIETPVV